MNLSEHLSDGVDLPLLSRLDCEPTEEELKNWVLDANTLHFSFKRLIALHTDVFWSTVVHNKSFLAAFDAALEAIPKPCDTDLYHLLFEWDSSAAIAAQQLRGTLLAVYLRIAVHNKEVDVNLSQKQWLQIVRDRAALPFLRAAAVWAHFPGKADIFVKTLNFTAKFDSKLKADAAGLAVTAKKAYQQLESNVRLLVDAFCTSEGARRVRVARLVEEFLHLTVDTFYSNRTVVEVLYKAGLITNQGINDWIAGVPPLIESAVRLFSLEILFDVAMTLSSYPLKRILFTMAQLEQSGADLFHSGCSFYSTAGDKFAAVQAALNNERFLFVLNERHNVAAILSDCEGEQRKYVETAVESICIQQTAEVLKKLDRFGLLQGLGDLDSLNEQRREAVAELCEMLPHLSPEYAHLCLRHFDFDVPSTVESFFSSEGRLPLDLRRVEAADLTEPESGRKLSALPPISYKDEELVLSALSQPTSSTSKIVKSKPAESEGKNVFKGLFSLAPPKPAETPVEKSTEQPKVSEVMLQLRAALDRLKLRAEGRDTAFEAQEGPDGERLVPMMTAKKYAGIKKFKTSDADKVAIRPTYEKYKYETPGEDNMYDDEYDDGFEQREFQVEPLNAALSSSSDEEGESSDQPPAGPLADGGNGQTRGGRGRGRGRGRGGPPTQQNNRGGGSQPNRGNSNGNRRGGNKKEQAPAGEGGSTAPVPQAARDPAYTGGRQRQMKERHKNTFKQRGADRKMRGAGAPF